MKSSLDRLLVWLAIVLLLLSFTSFTRLGPNPSSRFILTKSIANDSLELNKTDMEFYSGMDYSLKDGKYYSDKPPGISFLFVPLYFAGDFFANIGLHAPQIDTFRSAVDANAFFLMIIFAAMLNAVAAIRIYDIAKLLGFSNKISYAAMLLFAFATLFSVYAATLFSHAFTTTLLILATYHLLKIKFARIKKIDLLLAGIFLGFAVTTEYLVILLLPVFTAYCFFIDKKSLKHKIIHTIIFLTPIIIFGLLFAAYNTLAFGSPLASSYDYSSFKDTQNFDNPLLEGAYYILFSSWRGLFFYNPLLLLAIPGAWLLAKKLKIFRAEVLLFAVIILFFVVVIAQYSYFDGGLCYGPRHLLPTVPFLLLLALPMLDKNYYAKNKNGKTKLEKIYMVLIIVLVAISFFHSFLGSFVTSQPYPEINKNPIYEIVLPYFLAGHSNSYLFKTQPAIFLIVIAIVAAILIYERKKLKNNFENSAEIKLNSSNN
jgi:hypothetical protein